MQGTSVIIGTRYAWNIDYKGDQVCLERWSHWGPDMPGTLFDGDYMGGLYGNAWRTF